jgi:hypothetical protein
MSRYFGFLLLSYFRVPVSYAVALIPVYGGTSRAQQVEHTMVWTNGLALVGFGGLWFGRFSVSVFVFEAACAPEGMIPHGSVSCAGLGMPRDGWEGGRDFLCLYVE